MIVLEDLHVCGMQRNERLALSISDAGLRELPRQLAYLNQLGIVSLPVDRREVTPAGEEGSGASTDRRETSLVEAGSVSTPPPRGRTRSDGPKDLSVRFSRRDNHPNANPHFRRVRPTGRRESAASPGRFRPRRSAR
ncbi:MAG TPA: hypothetical protein VGJ77_21550, partial [Gaiellaceae bacterium]